jgi:muconolactone D-isomerase
MSDSEFLVKIEINVPPDIPLRERTALFAAEGARARQMAEDGTIVRLWRLAGTHHNWGLWSAPDPTALHAALTSLPLYPYQTITVIPLAVNANDPGFEADPVTRAAISSMECVGDYPFVDASGAMTGLARQRIADRLDLRPHPSGPVRDRVSLDFSDVLAMHDELTGRQWVTAHGGLGAVLERVHTALEDTPA